MKHMHKILFAIAFLFAGTAFGQQDKLFENRSLNKDLNLKVNIGGTQTTAVSANGTTGAITVGPSATAAGTSFHTANGSVVSTIVATGRGSFTSPTLAEYGANLYYDSSGVVRSISTATGYTQLNILRQSVSTNEVLQFFSNFQDAQTAGSSVVSTNEKKIFALTANGQAVFNSNQNGFALDVNNTSNIGNGIRYSNTSTNGAVNLIQLNNNNGVVFNVFADGSTNIGVDGANRILAKGYFHANASGGTAIATPGGNTSAIFQNNDTTGRNNNVFFIGGTAGGSSLVFGDSGNNSKGSINFSNSASTNTGAFTISNNMIFNGDGAAAKYFQFIGASSSSLASTDNTISRNFSLLVPASGAGATVYTVLGMMSVIMQASYTDTGIVMRLGGTNHQIRATFWLSSEGFNGPGETQPNIFSLAWATPTTVTNVSAATANFHSISDADFRWVNPGTSTPCNTTTCSLQCKLNGGPATAITLSGIVIVNAG